MTDQTVKSNKVVTFTYQILDDQGEVVEHSDIPMDYVHGVSNTMFPKVEHALEGKSAGDWVEVELSPAEGFGEYDENMTFTDDVENVPMEYRWVGARPTFENDVGETAEFVVSKIENGKLTVDGNHPFAGKTMTFRIKIVNIREATAADLNGTISPGPSILQ